jgi:hypothetical protein
MSLSPCICFGSGGRIRTYGLRVMSPTSYQTAPPRDEFVDIASNKLPVNVIFHMAIVRTIIRPTEIRELGHLEDKKTSPLLLFRTFSNEIYFSFKVLVKGMTYSHLASGQIL